MISPSDIKKINVVEIVELTKANLIKYIDGCLMHMCNKDEMVVSLSGARGSFLPVGYSPSCIEFYSDVLEPVIDEYRSVGWNLYYKEYFSLFHRDDLYFSTKVKNLGDGYNVIYKKNLARDFWYADKIEKVYNKYKIPSYKTIKEAEDWVKYYNNIKPINKKTFFDKIFGR